MDEQVRTNRRNIEQLRADENALATQLILLQKEVVQLRIEVSKQSSFIAWMCKELGIVPIKQKVMEH